MVLQKKGFSLRSIVLYTPYPPEHALTVLRISGPLRMAGVQVIGGGLNPDQVSLADAVVIQRDFPKAISLFNEVLARARAEAKPLIYEIDDLLFELPEEHPHVAAEFFMPALLPMLHAVLEADLVTTATERLRDYLLPLNSNIQILKNYLNEEIWKENPTGGQRDRLPVVVGFMGSDSHLPDLGQLVPVFRRLLEGFGDDIKLKFWGGAPPPEIRALPQVEWVTLAEASYPEFAGYFSRQESDIFIAPLADSVFNKCKSPIKFLEYSWLGVPGVYSRLTPYEGVVENGINGFLASTPEEWEACLSRLIEDSSLRAEMGMRAKQTVKDQWLLSQHAHRWKEVYRAARLSPPHKRTAPGPEQEKGGMLRILEKAEDWQQKKQEEIETLKRKIESQERKIESQERKIAEEVNRALALSWRIDEITASDAWKIANRLWSIRLALAPHGSHREALAQSVMRLLRNRNRGNDGRMEGS